MKFNLCQSVLSYESIAYQLKVDDCVRKPTENKVNFQTLTFHSQQLMDAGLSKFNSLTYSDFHTLYWNSYE